MADRVGPQDIDVTIKFGSGLHTRASEDEIDEREAANGHNFLVDLENSCLRPRPPFDLVATAPNAGSIMGGGSFRKSDGTVAAFFQAGDTVYDFDGSSFDASPVLDTVNASAKLRGHWRSHSWELGGKVLVSDLALLEVVKEWDGTTWADVAFLSNPSTSFGAFYSRYIDVSVERAMYSHIRDSGGTFGHMLVGSERSDYLTISVSDRPSSSLGEADPFFLLTPDLRKVNGYVQAFGTGILSTNQGRLFKLTGASAKDFSFGEFYPGSEAAGDESLAYIGNDVIYGRQGRVESVTDTDKFGDTSADDLTRGIADRVKDYTGWTVVFNSRLNRVYLFPDDQAEVWVFETSLRTTGKSPWMRWITSHALSFQPTFVMSMLDPGDKLEYVFMGDANGKVYRMEGTGTDGDAGTTEIQTSWTSKLFVLPVGARMNRVEGYLKYRKGDAFEASVQILYCGESVFDQGIVVSIPQVTADAHYMGAAYYNGAVYYGVAFRSRAIRQRIEIPGGDANEFQVRITVSSDTAFDINEIGLRFSAAN